MYMRIRTHGDMKAPIDIPKRTQIAWGIISPKITVVISVYVKGF